MRKIPTLFKRDPDDLAHVLPIVTEGCEWVLAGEGAPTRKYDGTCVMFDGENWWARRMVPYKKDWPEQFQFVVSDDASEKDIGWEPIQNSGFFKAFRDAIEGVHSTWPLPAGTYELCGPKINGNPEHLEHHKLFLHAAASSLLDAGRAHETLRRTCLALLYNNHIEGIVFHRTPGDPNTQMAKIKGRDFIRDKS